MPCVPGYDGDDSPTRRWRARPSAIGFPLMVKAAAGGGGRGMRRVHDAAQLPERDRARALRGEQGVRRRPPDPGDARSTRARHVEVQIVGRRHGHAIHLGERDCSVQRRFQKVIEEAPSPAVDAGAARGMGEPAVAGGAGASVTSASARSSSCSTRNGELLLPGDEHAHPGRASGDRARDRPRSRRAAAARSPRARRCRSRRPTWQLRGHAIEARLYAEDPARGFVPADRAHRAPAAAGRGGRARRPRPGAGLHGQLALRSDAGQARSRTARIASRRAGACCARSKPRSSFGVRTNQRFLQALLEHEAFIAARATTDFIERGWRACRASALAQRRLDCGRGDLRACAAATPFRARELQQLRGSGMAAALAVRRGARRPARSSPRASASQFFVQLGRRALRSCSARAPATRMRACAWTACSAASRTPGTATALARDRRIGRARIPRRDARAARLPRSSTAAAARSRRWTARSSTSRCAPASA